ncbi:hypothetical protein D3C81_1632340 [compost metagenome]
MHAAALQAGQNAGVGTFDIAVIVQVLDTQQPRAAMHLRIKITGHGGDERAHVQGTGGGGGEAADVGEIEGGHADGY